MTVLLLLDSLLFPQYRFIPGRADGINPHRYNLPFDTELTETDWRTFKKTASCTLIFYCKNRVPTFVYIGYAIYAATHE